MRSSNVITETTPLDRAFARYEQLKTLRTHEPAWLAERRLHAIERFQALGFPTTRDEEWKYTNPGPITQAAFDDAPEANTEAVTAHPICTSAPIRIVTANGKFSPNLSSIDRLPAGVWAGPLSAAPHKTREAAQQHLAVTADTRHHAFAALNTALFHEAVILHIPKNIVLEDPILHLNWADTQTATFPRLLVIAETNSGCTLIEAYTGPETASANTIAVSEYHLDEGARIDHYKVSLDSSRTTHIALHQAEAARSANFRSHNLVLAGGLTRNDIRARLGGEAAEATLNGLVVAAASQHVDNHTTIDHAMPHCPSHEVYKTILDGHATAVFNGKIFVRLDAQKTDAKQTNQTLLLSDEATIYTKPQLEILADDVKCTHGATVGRLDEKQIFYLRSRGIGPAEAKALLIYAFAGEIVQEIRVEALREIIDSILLKELPTMIHEVQI
jgi:Fe-S cluster assembly protein SufD